MNLGLIVEGQGDALALPVLVRRILHESLQRFDCVLVAPAFRVKRGRFHERFDDFESALTFLAAKCDAILVVLDSDDDDPEVLANGLQLRAETAVGHVPVAVRPAVREFEAWFLASVPALRGRRGVPTDAPEVPHSSEPRSAKSVFESLLLSGVYSETVDQPSFAAIVDLELCKRESASFNALAEAIATLTNEPDSLSADTRATEDEPRLS